MQRLIRPILPIFLVSVRDLRPTLTPVRVGYISRDLRLQAQADSQDKKIQFTSL